VSSLAQIAANQQNAQLSTGPMSPEGKAKASLNALKTGLTGRTVVLPEEDLAEYKRHIEAYEVELKPVGRCEADLVQSIADCAWRLNRIPGLEMALYAKGRVQLADSCADYEPGARALMIDLEVQFAFEKQIRNLHLQEARLNRRKEKDLAELRRLQQQRKEEDNLKRAERLEAAARALMRSRWENRSFDPKANGFEFPLHEVLQHIEKKPVPWITGQRQEWERSLNPAA